LIFNIFLYAYAANDVVFLPITLQQFKSLALAWLPHSASVTIIISVVFLSFIGAF